MRRSQGIRHEFVEYIPDVLEEGVLYVSVAFGTAVHKCCCGCGNEVVTPITPMDWCLAFDGETITLDPSIGNWSLPCESHYWITRNKVRWAPRWSRARIEAARARDRRKKVEHYDGEIHGTLRDE